MALVPFPNKAAKSLAGEELEPDWDDHPESDDGGKMSFLEHLDELRRRIIYSVVAVAVGFVGAWFFRDYLVAFVFGPMREFLSEGERLQGLDAAELFVVNIKLAAMAGLLVASPVVMSQIWLFIAPGLYAHEKKWAVPFVVLSTVCFVGGAAFAHEVVFRLTMQFFAGFENEYFTFAPRASNYFGIYLRLMLAFGLVFQLPVVVLFLAKMGVLTARFMITHFKYAVLGIFIISAVVTPGGEVVTQLAMAGPLTLLYIFSIGLAWAFGKKRKRDEDENESPR